MTYDQAVATLTGPGGPFELVELERDGVPLRQFAKAPASLVELLESSSRFDDRAHLVYEDDRYTFRDVLEIVAGLAQWMTQEWGVSKGDRVAIGMRNYPEWVLAFWATQALGAVAVPLNAWWTGPELRYALEDSQTAFAFVDGERYDRIGDDARRLGIPLVVVRFDGPLTEGAVRWSSMLAQLDRRAPMPDVEISPDDDATILYTSGTTGQPKGAIGTHRNHVTNVLNMSLIGAVQAMRETTPDASPTPVATSRPPAVLQTYPFFHIGGLTMVYMSAASGTKVVLQYKWDLERAFELIEREQVTSFAAVPTILRQVMDSPLVSQHDLSSLGTIGSGGAPVPPDLVARVDRLFAKKAAPSNGYGLTETSSAITANRGADYLAHPDSVGRVIPSADVRVVDPDRGEDQAPGAVGELWFRGPGVVRGYWNKPEATAESFTDGWFHTGDLGYVGEDGFIYVVDRLKDVVIRGGENVYCAEVEAAIFEHPGVADVAVVGLPHRELGEQVAAVVQLKPGSSASAPEIQEHVAARLARFKVPEQVFLRTDELPRTATGKVLKRQLRDELAAAVG